MSALPAATVEMINGLSDRNTRRLVNFIEELRKEEMPPALYAPFAESWARRLKGLDLFTDDFLADGIEDAPAQVREFL